MKGSWITTRQAKLQWLNVHRKLWEAMPMEYPEDDEHRVRLYAVAKKMIAEGFYSEKTYFLDVAMAVFKLIQKVRALRRVGVAI